MEKIYKRKQFGIFGVIISIVVIALFGLIISLHKPQKTIANDFNPNNLISDGSFTNINDMSEGEIQAFLEDHGSFLKNYSEDGRRAAKIIYDAAHGYGHASGECSGSTVCNGVDINTTTGTVSPKVILVTLQKEQSLITSSELPLGQHSIDWAMGYGCPDGSAWAESMKGFTNQVENAAWQLRYNYELAKQGRNYNNKNLGSTLWIPEYYGDDSPYREIHIDTAATASLYTYTPYIYNGNYNFWNTYNNWFIDLPYSNIWVTQNGNPSLFDGESYTFTVTVKNTGTETWHGEGSANPVRLGTSHNFDRTSIFTRGDNWVSNNRVKMQEDEVTAGNEAHFTFSYTIPSGTKSGVYRENFQVVMEGKSWMEDRGICWDIYVRPESEKYHAQLASQSDYTTLLSGQTHSFSLSLKNTGTTTWYQNSVSLGTDRDKDRIPAFIRGDGWASENRVRMVESSVAPGDVATFNFSYTVPDIMPAGVYREYFRPVADGIGWMEDYGIYWDITVLPGINQYHYSWVSQNAYPTLIPGQGYNFVLTVKNTGQATWKNSIVHLATDKDKDRISIFRREDLSNPYGNPSHWLSPNRVFMNEDTVAPGDNATFSFWMSPEQYQQLGTYKEYFRLVADGIGWMEDYGIHWLVTVDNPHSKWTSQSPYPTLHPGESTTVLISFKNTGNTTWQKTGKTPIRLGTANQLDRTSIFNSNWLSTNRIILDQDTVEPNQTGTFTFQLTAPPDIPPGTYREYFRPVADGVTWMEDNGVYLDVIVN